MARKQSFILSSFLLLTCAGIVGKSPKGIYDTFSAESAGNRAKKPVEKNSIFDRATRLLAIDSPLLKDEIWNCSGNIVVKYGNYLWTHKTKLGLNAASRYIQWYKNRDQEKFKDHAVNELSKIPEEDWNDARIDDQRYPDGSGYLSGGDNDDQEIRMTKQIYTSYRHNCPRDAKIDAEIEDLYQKWRTSKRHFKRLQFYLLNNSLGLGIDAKIISVRCLKKGRSCENAQSSDYMDVNVGALSPNQVAKLIEDQFTKQNEVSVMVRREYDADAPHEIREALAGLPDNALGSITEFTVQPPRKAVLRPQPKPYLNSHSELVFYSVGEQLFTDGVQAVAHNFNEDVAHVLYDSITICSQSFFKHLYTNQRAPMLSSAALASTIATDISFFAGKKAFERVSGKKVALPDLPIPTCLRKEGFDEELLEKGIRFVVKLALRNCLDQIFRVQHDPVPLL